MSYINVLIKGVPYAKVKSRGNVDGPPIWTKAIIEQTNQLPTVDGACMLRVTFLMPPDKYPTDFPFGPNIDNYLKRFQDALKKTIFRDAPGGDSCIIHLEASKVRVGSISEAGAYLEVLPHEGA